MTTKLKRPHPRVYTNQSDMPSMTKQSFKDECDINKIMAKFQKTGAIEHYAKHAPSYGDAFVSESKLHVTYRPLSSFIGEDTFTYTIDDGIGGTSEATIRIMVKLYNASDENAAPGLCSIGEETCTFDGISKFPFYRPMSGRGYNTNNSHFDAPAFTILLRHSPPAYADGYEEPAGRERP